MRTQVLFLAGLCLLACAARAEGVITKNGLVVEGPILRCNERVVIVESTTFGVMSISQEKIRAILSKGESIEEVLRTIRQQDAEAKLKAATEKAQSILSAEPTNRPANPPGTLMRPTPGVISPGVIPANPATPGAPQAPQPPMFEVRHAPPPPAPGDAVRVVPQPAAPAAEAPKPAPAAPPPPAPAAPQPPAPAAEAPKPAPAPAEERKVPDLPAVPAPAPAEQKAPPPAPVGF